MTPAEVLAERRQRAHEAGQDRYDPERDGGAIFAACLDEAIEIATRVQITDEVLAAAEAATGVTIHDYDVDEMHRVLAAAFAAAGFEIEN